MLHIKGVVQGVGFRPFVHRLATEERLSGWVQNTGDGVRIALSPATAAEILKMRLLAEAPRLARIDTVSVEPWEGDLPPSFEIRQSEGGPAQTDVTPDAAFCPDCAAELDDPDDRRHGYPFLNCTACGPRFSIISEIPYDRANTSMAAFEMCILCAEEFSDPLNRRFHAEPTACPECGPRLWFEDKTGRTTRDVIARACELLHGGGILALRGIGGFHLACLATQEASVAALRTRKNRPSKPFATMVRDLDVARRFAEMAPAAKAELVSAAAPIVLAPLTNGEELAPSVTCGLSMLGIMLPYSPLHHLLLADFDVPLVMTSGNAGGAPQTTSNDAARTELATIADGFLLHDRDIKNRVDDSVVQITRSGPQVLRRARGLAPASLPLPPGLEDAPDAIAFGADLKNAFALSHNGCAILSQHIGDLTDFRCAQDLAVNVELLTRLFDCQPKIVICDLHGGYESTRAAEDFARSRMLPIYHVQHHHAHAASLMAEHGLGPDASIFALAQDGLGLGDDSEIWGAEFLAASYTTARRLATLRPAELPGGDVAAREPWRNLVSRLVARYGEPSSWPASYFDQLAEFPTEAICSAIRSQFNAPLASSSGRLFDAVAAAIGLASNRQSFEGQAAMMLEKSASDWIRREGPPEPYELLEISGEVDLIDPAPIWDALVEDVGSGGPGFAAARFHISWADAWAAVTLRKGVSGTVCLTGGTFQNQLLAWIITDRLEAAGFDVLQHASVPPNDGGIALGQLAIGLSKHAHTMGEDKCA